MSGVVYKMTHMHTISMQYGTYINHMLHRSTEMVQKSGICVDLLAHKSVNRQEISWIL